MPETIQQTVELSPLLQTELSFPYATIRRRFVTVPGTEQLYREPKEKIAAELARIFREVTANPEAGQLAQVVLQAGQPVLLELVEIERGPAEGRLSPSSAAGPIAGWGSRVLGALSSQLAPCSEDR